MNTEDETIEEVIEAAEAAPDERIKNAAPLAEKLLELLAAAKPPAREYGVNDHDALIEIYSPIVSSWLSSARDSNLNQREVDFAVGLFIAYSDILAELIKASVDQNIEFAERSLLTRTLGLDETLVSKKDLTLGQWDDIINAGK